MSPPAPSSSSPVPPASQLPGPAIIAAGIVVAFSAAVVGGSLVLALSGADSSDDLTLAQASAIQVFGWVGYLGVPLYAARRWGGARAVLGWEIRRWDVPVGLLWGVVTQAGIWLLIYWPLELLFDSLDAGAEAREVVERGEGLGVVVIVLLAVVGAPIVEELYFRGLSQRILLARMSAPVAVGITAVVFAGTHLQPLQFPGLLVFGGVAGALAARRGRIAPAIAAHAGFNATAVAALLLAG